MRAADAMIGTAREQNSVMPEQSPSAMRGDSASSKRQLTRPITRATKNETATSAKAAISIRLGHQEMRVRKSLVLRRAGRSHDSVFWFARAYSTVSRTATPHRTNVRKVLDGTHSARQSDVSPARRLEADVTDAYRKNREDRQV
jgi:hypothetical protein